MSFHLHSLSPPFSYLSSPASVCKQGYHATIYPVISIYYDANSSRSSSWCYLL